MTAPVPALSTSADVEAVLRDHQPNGYFTARDGHRECYCGHVLMDHETLVSHLAEMVAAALSTPPTEGTTVTEWGVRWTPKHDVDPEHEPYGTRTRHPWTEADARGAARRMPEAVAYSRQRTTYPDRVTEWTEVTP